MAGSKNGEATLFKVDELVASTKNLEEIDVIIDTSARDAGNSTTTNLRKGLVLAPISASGKYAQFLATAIDGTQTSADIVILAYDVNDLDEGDQIATAYFTGTFHSAAVLVASGADPTWADVQRIRRR